MGAFSQLPPDQRNALRAQAQQTRDTVNEIRKAANQPPLEPVNTSYLDELLERSPTAGQNALDWQRTEDRKRGRNLEPQRPTR